MKPSAVKNLLVLMAGLVLSQTSAAQETVPADRPGAGFTTLTTPKNAFVVETGFLAGPESADIGLLFLKTGLSDRLELQFNAGSIVFNTNSGESRVSSQSVAFKYHLGTGLEDQLRISLYSRTVLPFLNENDEYWSTRLMVLADYSKGAFSVNSNLGYGDFVDDISGGSTNFSFTPALSISQGLNFYIGYSLLRNDLMSYSFVESGFSYLAHPKLQLDIGLQLDSDNALFAGGGLATSF